MAYIDKVIVLPIFVTFYIRIYPFLPVLFFNTSSVILGSMVATDQISQLIADINDLFC
jgi:hypothetical protein